MTDARSPEVQVALRFLQEWSAGNMTAAADLLDEAVTFRSPANDLTGRAQVAAVMGEFAQLVTGIDIVVATDHGPDVVVVYDMHTGPFGTMRVAEHFQIHDGRITADDLVFDTAPMSQGPRA